MYIYIYIYIPYIYVGVIKIDYMSLNLESFAINHMLYHYWNFKPKIFCNRLIIMDIEWQNPHMPQNMTSKYNFENTLNDNNIVNE